MEAKEILEQMTLQEKIALCSGKDFWHLKGFEKYGIPSIMVTDGPHGLRKQVDTSDMLGLNESVPATCFPTAVISACSWDKNLLGEMGKAIAEEGKANGVAVVLGPGACMKRDPLCGRNFEYFSEDPFLAGKLAGSFIKQAESTGVGTSLKHFACNNQEYKRFSSDSIVDERALREIYLSGFEIATKEGKPSTIMCAYNKINGTHCATNKELLTDILRNEWGYEGLVVTDWGAMSNRIEGFKAGCDLNMPGGSAFMEKAVLKAVKEGKLSEEDINKCAERVLSLILEKSKNEVTPCDMDAHHALAQKIAEESAVLLKNDGVLPLKNEKVVVIGRMGKTPRYQGAGSSHIVPTKLVSLVDVLNCDYVEATDERGNLIDAEGAKTAASQAEVAIVCVGLTDNYESEGFDRTSMQMPEGHLKLIEEVSSVAKKTVVVLFTGSVVETPWLESVDALLYMGLPGQAGGEATKRILYGEVNPSGKLAETWAKSYTDVPTSIGTTKDVLYKESIYIGYRYFEKANVPVQFPFGSGLSYTKFEISNEVVEGDTVRATVTNVGEMDGAEVVQLYVAPPQDGVYRPVKELKGFEKVFLKVGESKEVSFALDSRSFAVWNNGWVIPKGEYQILVGNGLATAKVVGSIKKDGVTLTDNAPTWYHSPNGEPSQEDFEKLIGREYHEPILKKGEFTMDNSILEMKDHALIMKIMYTSGTSVIAKGKDKDDPDVRMLIASSMDCSLSGMQINAGMSDGVVRGFLEMANGHFFKGLYKMITGKI